MPWVAAPKPSLRCRREQPALGRQQLQAAPTRLETRPRWEVPKAACGNITAGASVATNQKHHRPQIYLEIMLAILEALSLDGPNDTGLLGAF